MPLWRIYHAESVFTDAQKAALASSITKLYSPSSDAGLPQFYTNVVFVPLSSKNIFVGGESAPKFVRFTIEQIARTFKNNEQKAAWLKMIDQALKPHLKDRGDLTWEYHIVETGRELWEVSGIVPPWPGTEAEKRWRRENKASEYAEAENVRSKL